MAVKTERLAGLKWIGTERGYKPGWAAQQFRNGTGSGRPNGMDPAPSPPSLEVSNWIKAQTNPLGQVAGQSSECVRCGMSGLAMRARGRWRGILASLGIPESFLSGKHGPCPFAAKARIDSASTTGRAGAPGFATSAAPVTA